MQWHCVWYALLNVFFSFNSPFSCPWGIGKEVLKATAVLTSCASSLEEVTSIINWWASQHDVLFCLRFGQKLLLFHFVLYRLEISGQCQIYWSGFPWHFPAIWSNQALKSVTKEHKNPGKCWFVLTVSIFKTLLLRNKSFAIMFVLLCVARLEISTQIDFFWMDWVLKTPFFKIKPQFI